MAVPAFQSQRSFAVLGTSSHPLCVIFHARFQTNPGSQVQEVASLKHGTVFHYSNPPNDSNQTKQIVPIKRIGRVLFAVCTEMSSFEFRSLFLLGSSCLSRYLCVCN